MTPDCIVHGVASSGKVGAYTGVAWVSFLAFDERGVEGLLVAVAGCAAGLCFAVLCLPHQWAVRRGGGLRAPSVCLLGVVGFAQWLGDAR